MLPLLVSVPHAGLWIPPEVEPICALTPEEIATDGDGGAAEIYAFEAEVGAFVTTGVARAIVDMNRSRGNRKADGVVKTHTSYNWAARSATGSSASPAASPARRPLR